MESKSFRLGRTVGGVLALVALPLALLLLVALLIFMPVWLADCLRLVGSAFREGAWLPMLRWALQSLMLLAANMLINVLGYLAFYRFFRGGDPPLKDERS